MNYIIFGGSYYYVVVDKKHLRILPKLYCTYISGASYTVPNAYTYEKVELSDYLKVPGAFIPDWAKEYFPLQVKRNIVTARLP